LTFDTPIIFAVFVFLLENSFQYVKLRYNIVEVLKRGEIFVVNIAICDDESNITNQLYEVIKQYQMEKMEEINCDIYHNGEGLLMVEKEYDIIFLDIYMTGIDGIETAKRLRKKDKTVEIIYLTSYSGLTKEALSVHAFEYLEKPIQKEDIYKQLDEVIMKILCKKVNDENRHHIIEFNGGRTKIRLSVDEIYYFEREDRRIKVTTQKGNFILYESIASIEDKLHPFDFVLPHQSFVINLNYIKNYFKGQIIMMNNDIIPIAQKRASDFKQCMRMFLQKKLESD
jgi:DNA-binding LytR/AlgR family response regulator